MKHVKEVLCIFDLKETWYNLGGNNAHRTVSMLRQQMQSAYEKQWHAQINGLHHPNEHKLRTYCQFKSIF